MDYKIDRTIEIDFPKGPNATPLSEEVRIELAPQPKLYGDNFSSSLQSESFIELKGGIR